MHLFPINEEQVSADKIVITGKELHHLKNVLRTEKNDLVVFHDRSFLYKTKVLSLDPGQCICEILSREPFKKRSSCTINLYQSLIQYSKFETVLDLSTQMGVSNIYPMHTQFTQKYELSSNRMDRWQKIIRESGKQSFNPSPPVLHPVLSFSNAINTEGGNCLLHPDSETSLKKFLSGIQPSEVINLFIGPEAGFSEDEIKLAIQNKFYIVTLPYNILRAETAALCVISNIFFYFQ